MARSLPISDPLAPPQAASNATQVIAGLSDSSAPGSAPDATVLSGTVEVFDPAMCCPTGVCGPGVDPALLQIARDLRWLTAKGVRVTRAGLAQEPQAFVAHARVSGLLQAFGDQALPAVIVNDVVLSHGRYPTRDELLAALAPVAAPSALAGEGASSGASSSGCCTPGSGCC